MESRTTTAQAEYIDTAEVAKLIRKALTVAFPGTVFAVRTQRYAGGSHVNVSWTDGPPAYLVERVTRPFSGRTFDGMDDSTHYHDSVAEDGRLVHYSGSAPSCSRRESRFAELVEEAREMILARCHVEGEGSSARFGGQWVDTLAQGMVYACDLRDEAFSLWHAYRRVVLRET